MSADPFLAIKAQLDAIARNFGRDEERFVRVIATLKGACQQIAEVTEDEHGNGARYAAEIAKKALGDTSDWP